MVKPLLLCFALSFGATAVLSQPAGRDQNEPAWDRARVASHGDEAQKRRAALRAAVQIRVEDAAPPRTGPAAVRQLNQQERDELRQQLRQQRRETLREIP